MDLAGVEITVAVASDVDALAQTLFEHQQKWTQADLLAAIEAPSSHLKVAVPVVPHANLNQKSVEPSARWLGFYLAQDIVDERHLHFVAVNPQWQGIGLGKHLLRDLIDGAVHAGIRRVLLEVRGSNHRARSLYAAMGFAVDGRRKSYYPPATGKEREDALLMSLMLPATKAADDSISQCFPRPIPCHW